MRTKASLLIALAALAATAAGCTVSETEAPELAGPSELALSLSVQATPDVLTQDGQSQASVTVDARGPSNQPVRGLSLRVDTRVGGVAADYGTLSARTIVTGDDGRARVTYTAPPEGPPGSPGSIVALAFVPIGSDYSGAVERSVEIRLIPRGVILPPNSVSASFTVEPASPVAFQNVVFNASGSTDGGVACGDRCTYRWQFGDQGTGTGMVATHQYRSAGTFAVTLVVTNQNGQSGQTTRSVTVGASTRPTAAFTFSPSSPGISQDVFFNASASQAAPGRSIVSYDWDFGNGRTGSGMTTSRRFDQPGEYTVTLNVTDDASQVGTATQLVTVGQPGTGLVANLVFSPTNPTPGTLVFFDARASRGPSPIVRYQFDFGAEGVDPDPFNTTGITSRPFAVAGVYVVRVTVYDSQNRSATTTVSVTVAEPEEP